MIKDRHLLGIVFLLASGLVFAILDSLAKETSYFVPVLQVAFHTVALTARDWVVTTLVAAVLLIGMEAVKLLLRAKRLAAPAAYQ